VNLSEFFVKGYTSINDEHIYSLLNVDSDVNKWCRDSYGTRAPKDVSLEAAHKYIADNYIKPIAKKYEIGYNSIWEGIDKPTREWHNDLVENNNNVFFMYYLNDVLIGGELCFRMNGIETGMIQPRRYLLVMGSQEQQVEHKVIPTTETRVACNFGFKVEWI
jgi:hypothetical protein